MNERLHLSERHRTQLMSLLLEHLPGVEVWAYGSRVNGRSHDGSDLDLILRSSGLNKISHDRLARFEEAVRQSRIPFLVEVRNWEGLPQHFRRKVERHCVLLNPNRRVIVNRSK